MINEKINEIRVLAYRLSFPILLFVSDDRQRKLVMRFNENTKDIHYRTEDICRWAHALGIEYEILVSRIDRLLPWRHLQYLRNHSFAVIYPHLI